MKQNNVKNTKKKINIRAFITMIVIVSLLVITLNYMGGAKKRLTGDKCSITDVLCEVCRPQDFITLGVIAAFIVIIFNNDINNIFGGTSDCPLCVNFLGGQFSNWQISHFLLFMLIGLICKDQLYTALIAGLGWELFELYSEYDNMVVQSKFLCDYVNKCDNKKIPTKKFWKSYLGLSNEYELYYCSAGIYGQILDMVFNILGYLTGCWIAGKYINK